MKEVRLSVPVIGGVTVVYTQAEIEAKKQAMKQSVKTGLNAISRFFSSLADKMER
jgi:hypothetical protein